MGAITPPAASMAPVAMAPVPGSRKKVSGAGYWIGAVVLVLGAGIGLIMIVSAVTGWIGEIQNAPRVEVGQTGTVNVARTGCQDLYLVASTGTPSLTTPKITVTSAEGSNIPVNPAACPSAGSTSTAGLPFRTVGSIILTTSGTYTVKVERPSGVAASGQGIVIARPFDEAAQGMGGQVLGGMAIGFAGFVLGLIVIIITAIRRGRAKRASIGLPPPGYGGPMGAAPYPAHSAPPSGAWGTGPPIQPGWGPPSGAPPAQAPAPTPGAPPAQAPAPGPGHGSPPPSDWQTPS